MNGQPRYQELARRYSSVVAEAGTCGCHVHVGVPSREAEFANVAGAEQVILLAKEFVSAVSA